MNPLHNKTILMIGEFPPPPGGATLWNEKLAKGLMENNIELLTVPWYGNPPKGAKKILLPKVGRLKALIFLIFSPRTLRFIIRHSFFKKDAILGISKMAFYAKNILKKLDWKKEYLIYCSHASYKALLGIFIKDIFPSARVIVRAHGSDILKFAEEHPRLSNYILNRVDKISVNCQFMKGKCISKGIPEKKIDLTPSGFKFVHKERPKKQNMILFVGYLEEHKNPMAILKLVPKIITNFKDELKFVFIGDGSLKRDMLDFIEKNRLERFVELLGILPNEEVLKYQAKARIFVLPSKREAFGGSAIEAMMNHTPCIVTQVGGMPENVGDGGIIVENTEEIADHILELLTNHKLWNEMSRRAFERSKRYDMNKIISQFIDTLSEL